MTSEGSLLTNQYNAMSNVFFCRGSPIWRSCWKQRKVLQPMRHMRKTTSKNVVWSFVDPLVYVLMFFCFCGGGGVGDLKKIQGKTYFRPVNKQVDVFFSCLLDLLSLSIQWNFNYRKSYLRTMCSRMELWAPFDEIYLCISLHFHLCTFIGLPSWEVTYPSLQVCLKMIFSFFWCLRFLEG